MRPIVIFSRAHSSWVLIVFGLLWPGPLLAQSEDNRPAERETLAVLDLEVIGGKEVVGVAFSERLREKLLATGRYRLVDPGSREAVAEEQTLQQGLCQDEACQDSSLN